MPSPSKQKKMNLRNAALAGLAVACLATKTVEARGAAGVLSPRGLYSYNRRPNTLDLMGDIFSMPIYFNSLMKQQEIQMERLHRSTPRYYVDEQGPDGSELAMEIPGVSASDLSVQLEDGHMLHISGTRRFNRQGKVVESTFDQLFRLDEDADVDNLTVTLSAGILRVKAPKKEKTVKQLPVTLVDETTETIEENEVNKEQEHVEAKVVEVDGLAISEEDTV